MSLNRGIGRRLTRLILWSWIAAALCPACKEPKHVVGQVGIAEETLRGNPMMGMSPAQVNELFLHKLSQGPFDLPSGTPRASSGEPPIGLRLEIAFTREAQKEGREGTFAEVGAQLTIRRKDAEGTASYEVVGVGESKLESEDPQSRRSAMRLALSSALDQVTGLAHLKNAGAVPSLIDLAKGKDPSFVREIIFALGEIGGDEAEAYLYTVAEGHDQPAVRAAAQKALDELRAKTRSAGRADSKANR